MGLSQPWRFVIVDDPARRRAVLENFRVANADALKSYADDLAARYAELKLAGLAGSAGPTGDLRRSPQPTPAISLGRRTMPEMAEYSVVAAIMHDVARGPRRGHRHGLGLDPHAGRTSTRCSTSRRRGG